MSNEPTQPVPIRDEDVSTLKSRRTIIQALVFPDGLDVLGELVGSENAVPLAIRALATEVAFLGCNQLEDRETLAGVDVMAHAAGAFLNGVTGLGEGEPQQGEGEDKFLTDVRMVFRERGIAIREGAGIEPLVAS